MGHDHGQTAAQHPVHRHGHFQQTTRVLQPRTLSLHPIHMPPHRQEVFHVHAVQCTTSRGEREP
jgi:hypothetical protein